MGFCFRGCHLVASCLFTVNGCHISEFSAQSSQNFETEDSSTTLLPGNFYSSVSISNHAHLMNVKQRCTKNPTTLWLHAITSLLMEVRTNLEESQAMSVRPGAIFSAIHHNKLHSVFCMHSVKVCSPWQHFEQYVYYCSLQTSIFVCISISHYSKTPIPTSSNQVDVLGVLPSE